ncbi:hypothetical protein BDL97_17G024300 [Sphagnum fallax]|nr:hypothetical protein BDL97_17G024300 [Sphagnum fallax]KAH8935377.1 hypothetical protein BDL97_17G024300 [Sphagnum fallax]KAH8935378.1 hypothetical protein BDL97_17G024300 [Sphagnum fallax]KAH8935379.1 hypothetical protein BDL97_17G024300 [Sphagnum fallax]
MASQRECSRIKQQMHYASSCDNEYLCPTCGQTVGQLKVRVDWTVLPPGVRFNPSDEELLEHLLAKVGGCGSAKEHPLIDDFIMTLDKEDGICRTHPENLPGVKKDGSACHYFYRPSMAYTTGTRKRRKIQTEYGIQGDLPCQGEEVRWHKTGKTRPILQDGAIQGFKKIMVLYRTSLGKKSKNVKTNWVMHQYHLGKHEEERDGEIVVCKVFLQKQPRRSTGLPAPGHGQKMVLLSPIDDQDDDLGSEAASESNSGFQELLLPSPGFKSVNVDSPISVSGVTREILPTTPKLYARSARLQGNHSKAEPTESTIPGIISLAQSFEQHDPRLAIQHIPESLVEVMTSDVNNTPDNSFGGHHGNPKAFKEVPAAGTLAPNKITNLVEVQLPTSILLPATEHIMVDTHDSIVAGNLLLTHCELPGEVESFQTIINLDDEDQLPHWEAIDPEGQAVSVEDSDLNDCDHERLAFQVHCSERINAANRPLLQKALSFGDHNWQRYCHDAFDHVGHILDDQEIDETIHEVDPALHNIVLDTPPDMFEYPNVSSSNRK